MGQPPSLGITSWEQQAGVKAFPFALEKLSPACEIISLPQQAACNIEYQLHYPQPWWYSLSLGSPVILPLSSVCMCNSLTKKKMFCQSVYLRAFSANSVPRVKINGELPSLVRGEGKWYSPFQMRSRIILVSSNKRQKKVKLFITIGQFCNTGENFTNEPGNRNPCDYTAWDFPSAQPPPVATCGVRGKDLFWTHYKAGVKLGVRSAFQFAWEQGFISKCWTYCSSSHDLTAQGGKTGAWSADLGAVTPK